MRKLLMAVGLVSSLFLVDCNKLSKNSAQHTATANTDRIAVTHKLGTTEVPRAPQRVVVMDYSLLDTFDALDIPIVAFPSGYTPKHLMHYDSNRALIDAGNLLTPNFEKINELQPDLIATSEFQQDLYKEFSEIAPTVYFEIDQKNYLTAFKKNNREIGRIFQKEAAVEAALDKIDQRLKDLNTTTQNSGKVGLVVLANEGKFYAFGKGSRFGLIHEIFGIPPTDQNIEPSPHGQSISSEFIQHANPDYLFVIDRGAVLKEDAVSKDAFSNALIRTTKAYKNDKIVMLSPDLWYLTSGGLQSMNLMIDEIEAAVRD